jgi:predicted nuclease of predicted toxin-antitoxin system
MKIIIDESVTIALNDLERQGFELYYIGRQAAGIDDLDIVELANDEIAIIVTEDKDFGDYAFRMQLVNQGIVLIRLSGLSHQLKKKLFLNVF